MFMDNIVARMQPEFWPRVREIYIEGLSTGIATFEMTAPAWEEWDQEHLACCRLVACWQGRVVGWAALSPVSRRPVYVGVAEVSVYVAAEARGKGIGKTLLETLIAESEQTGIWTLQAAIFAENSASQGLHLACGFRMVGRRERIGHRDGIWHDTVLMERRSGVVTLGDTKTNRIKRGNMI
jgi:L-amino acid N-acyltransferase YncA